MKLASKRNYAKGSQQKKIVPTCHELTKSRFTLHNGAETAEGVEIRCSQPKRSTRQGATK